jgi:hypothetical protein
LTDPSDSAEANFCPILDRASIRRMLADFPFPIRLTSSNAVSEELNAVSQFHG